jgi:hypothetical protein
VGPLGISVVRQPWRGDRQALEKQRLHHEGDRAEQLDEYVNRRAGGVPEGIANL